MSRFEWSAVVSETSRSAFRRRRRTLRALPRSWKRSIRTLPVVSRGNARSEEGAGWVESPGCTGTRCGSQTRAPVRGGAGCSFRWLWGKGG
jgi:hypothetical protein